MGLLIGVGGCNTSEQLFESASKQAIRLGVLLHACLVLFVVVHRVGLAREGLRGAVSNERYTAWQYVH